MAPTGVLDLCEVLPLVWLAPALVEVPVGSIELAPVDSGVSRYGRKHSYTRPDKANGDTRTSFGFCDIPTEYIIHRSWVDECPLRDGCS